MPCRGIRGAITVASDTEADILQATSELLAHIVTANGVEVRDVTSALFTVTADLTATFPSRAARAMGWQRVPLLNAQEIPVPNALPRCVRVLILWNTDKRQDEIQHIYLGEAALLRPDLMEHGGQA